MISIHMNATADAAKAFPPPKCSTRPAPFSLRLTPEERLQLEYRANGLPLGAFIKSQLFGSRASRPVSKATRSIKDPEALAKALALLGQSRIASNLNQLAKAANIGMLPVMPDVIDEIEEACAAVANMRRLLIEALGLKAGGHR